MSDDVVENRHALVSQRLRDRRRDLGLTQKQVVTRLARLGIRTTNKALSCQEHGSGLDVAKLPDLARALDCTTTYLLGLTDSPHRWEPDRGAQPTADTRRVPETSRTRRTRSADRQQGDEMPSVHRRATWLLGPDVPGRPLTERHRANGFNRERGSGPVS